MDEIDSVIKGDQTILARLFSWPQLQGSVLVLIGIANDISLPQRVLPLLSKRQFVPQEVVFHPYKHQQLVQILTQRLQTLAPATTAASSFSAASSAATTTAPALDFFDPMAIALCARRV